MTNTYMTVISFDDATKLVADQSNNAAASAAELSSQTDIDAKTLKPNGCSKNASVDVSFVDEFINDAAFAEQLKSPRSSPQPSQQSSQSQPSDDESSQRALAPRPPVVFESDIGPEAIEANDTRKCTVTVDGNVVKIGDAHTVSGASDARNYVIETIDTTIPSSVNSSQSFADDEFIATILNNDSADYRS